MYSKGKWGQEGKGLELSWLKGDGRQLEHFRQWGDKEGRRKRKKKEEKEILSAQGGQEGQLTWLGMDGVGWLPWLSPVEGIPSLLPSLSPGLMYT